MTEAPTSPSALNQFRALVLRDSALQELLAQSRNPDSFVEFVIDEGGRRGFQFTQDEVRAAMRANRKVFALRRMVV